MPENSQRRTFISDLIIVAVFAIICASLCFVDAATKLSVHEGSKEKAQVQTVDNSSLITLGLLKQGEQLLTVKVLSGNYKGQIFNAVNIVRAQMDLDKIFNVGDTILVGIPQGSNPDSTINAQDFYRIDWTIALLGLFAILLIVFAGMTGLKAMVSFVFSWLVIWKIVVPLCLNGFNAIAICLVAVTMLSAVIIFLVAGFTRKGVVAFLGACLGVIASCSMAIVFTKLFKINGAVMPFSQALLYSGFENLSLSDLYIGAIFLSSSGAVMDLGMDVSAGMREIAIHKPDISRLALAKSGFNIGRSVVGTMTTTLLLAYSGGYLTLLMTFAAQGVEPIDFINNPYVASESVKTIIGSFGIVLVAPFTAIVGAYFYGRVEKRV